MRIPTRIIVAALTASAVGVAAMPSLAQSTDGAPAQQLARGGDGYDNDRRGPRAGGPRHEGQQARGRHHDGERMQGGRGHDRGQARGEGGGPHGGPGMQAFIERFDADGDGTITAAEIETVTTTRLATFDANGDQVLSLEEFTALWTDAMQRPIVRSFQSRDTDGDGKITLEEYSVQADRMVSRLDRDDDGSLSDDELRGPRGQRGGPQSRGRPPAPDQAPPAESGPAQDN